MLCVEGGTCYVVAVAVPVIEIVGVGKIIKKRIEKKVPKAKQ
jgi:hypothetical protein